VNELVAVLAAVAASIAFAASDVIEQRAAHTVAGRRLLDLRLFVDLVASRLWLVGIAVDISASALQAVALRFGPLSLVQPILVCDLLFAAVMSAAVARRRPDRVMAAGVVCCAGGLALFQAVARPSGGKVTVSPAVLLPLGVGLAAAIAICAVAARLSPKKGLPLVTAFACGAVFGVTAFLLKEITQTIGRDSAPRHSNGRFMRSSSSSRSDSCSTRTPSRKAPSSHRCWRSAPSPIPWSPSASAWWR
jgi:hypothetical protein